MTKKLFKACGIRTKAAALCAEISGVDMVGMNFVPTSKRYLSLTQARSIRSVLNKTKAVGVFQNQTLSYVNQMAVSLNLNYLQLSGNENLAYVRRCRRPVIKTVTLLNRQSVGQARKYLTEPNVAFIIFDSIIPGSGQAANHKLLDEVDFSYLIAGGVRIDNINSLAKSINPLGFDVASGIEDSQCKISLSKIKVLQVAISEL